MANIKNSLKKRCNVCNKLLSPNEFYKTQSEFAADGRISFCKKCFAEKCLNDDKTDIDLDRFKQLLRMCDKPFWESKYEAALSEADRITDKTGADKVGAIVGSYMKIFSLHQYKDKTWGDGDLNKKVEVGGQTKQITYPIWIYGNQYTAEQMALAKALYDYWAKCYPIKSKEEQKVITAYIHNRILEECFLMSGDSDFLVETNNEIVNEICKLKSMGSEQDADFAEWYADLMTIAIEEE